MNSLARFRRLAPERQWLLAEAVVTLGIASAAVALFPFRTAIKLGAVPLTQSSSSVSIDDCVWSVEAAARRVPVRAKCIEQGIALQRMLRRRGVDARLHYGARIDPATAKLEAHVWVTVGSKAVIGGDELKSFGQLVTYP